MQETKRIFLTKNFRKDEFTCKCGCGLNNINPLHVHRLQIARNLYKRAIKITSGCRCVKHNNDVGGKDDSTHIDGLATDLLCTKSRERFYLLTSLTRAGFKRIGIGEEFIHVDSGITKPQNVIFLYGNSPTGT